MTTKKKTAKKTRPAWANTFRSRLPEEEEKVLDDTPIEMPAGYSVPTPLTDLIATMVREAVQSEQKESFETPEEADDFDIDDDELLNLSPYELTELEDQEPMEKPVVRAQESHETPSEAPQETITPPEEPPAPEQVEKQVHAQ